MNSEATPSTNPIDNATAKLIACVVILVCLAVGLAGLILPIIPGLLFLGLAALIAARHSPALERLFRSNATLSGYLDPRAAPDRQPPLVGDARTDVAIVGGGLTGLSTALALRRAGVDAVVLEREFCGFGASGRNAGHLTPTIGKDLPTLLMMYGEERTKAIVRFADHCVHRTEALLAEWGIDCDYAPTGNVMAVVHPKQEKRLRRIATRRRSSYDAGLCVCCFMENLLRPSRKRFALAGIRCASWRILVCRAIHPPMRS